jgi:hypothetical protein
VQSPLQTARTRARAVRKRSRRPVIDRHRAHAAALAALADAQVVVDAPAAEIKQGSRTREAPAPLRVPVVMCVWNRLERVTPILCSIERSFGVQADVYLWNNRPDATGRIVAELRGAGHSLPKVTMATSSLNIGGFGRFYWAREIAKRHPYVVFIDDDQVLGHRALHDLVQEHAPLSIHSVWAFRFKNRNEYWSRRHVGRGEQAKYVGTGGMIADSSIFADDGLFRCPSRYWFMEDIWLSYYAQAVRGWNLYRSAAEIGMMLDDRGLTAVMRPAKQLCFRELNKDSRWRDLAPASSELVASDRPGITGPC